MAKIKGNETQRAQIEKSRSKTKPFKLSLIAENGEKLMTSQLMTTRLNCLKNLRSVMRVFGEGVYSSAIVLDLSGSAAKQYRLYADGFQKPMDVMLAPKKGRPIKVN